MAVGQGLTPEQIAAFEQDGYLIIPNALSQETVSELLEETHSLLDNFSLDDHPMTKFSTGENSEHVGDDYFLSSGDRVRFFFEEEPWKGTRSGYGLFTSPASAGLRLSGVGNGQLDYKMKSWFLKNFSIDAFDSTGTLTKPKSKAINKIGHYLHVLSPPFASILSPPSPKPYSPSAIARSLSFKQPQCLQSMIICKQPEIGGAVPPHQDSTFLYTNPPSAVGFWYALEDATKENGCLRFLKGSHHWAPIKKRFVRNASGAGTEFINNDGKLFPDVDRYGGRETAAQERAEYELGEVTAGSLVLIHGNLLHKSERNNSSKGRIIYTFHVIEGQDTVYDERNWLQPPKAGFTNL